MPGYFQSFIREHGLERTVCDYIAGMTDRFAARLVPLGHVRYLRIPRCTALLHVGFQS